MAEPNRKSFRVVYGERVASHQKKVRDFSSEAVRWRVICEGLEGIREIVPFHEKGLSITIGEMKAYAVMRRKSAARDEGLIHSQGVLEL